MYRRDLAGAVADLGLLVPIATALIVKSGLSATAVLLPAGLLYIAVAFTYRLPVPVQPLKAFGAIAIAQGLGSNVIAAGALLMGAIFLVLGRTGLMDLAARAFPRALVRGVQLTVGLLFLKIAWGLVHDAPKSFRDHSADPTTLLVIALAVFAAALLWKRRLVSLAFLGAGLGVALARAAGGLAFGPSAIALPHLDWAMVGTALTVLVLPQVPLTFAHSCISTSGAARTYFCVRGARVRVGLLRDLRGVGSWALALTTGLVGFESNLSIALAIGLVLWWLPVGAVRVAALAGGARSGS